MRVTFFGVRGSSATPGPATVRYGGNTVCVEVVLSDGTVLILDAGTGLRVLGQAHYADPQSSARQPIHLLITHVHWDHILGLPFFLPLWRRDARLVLHGLSPRAHERLSRALIFDGEYFPVRAEDVPAQLSRPPYAGAEVTIGPARVRRVALNHPGECDGFRIDDADGRSLCYLTDNELVPPASYPPRTTLAELARFADGADLVIHDAQYLPQDLQAKHGWGHSAIPDVLELGRLCGARRLALFHHDPDRDDDALDRIAAEAAAWLRAHAPGTAGMVAREGLQIAF